MKKKVLITGGSGLLAVNWALSIRDEYEVSLLLHQRKISLQGVKTDKMPISSIDGCIDLVNKHQPDVVIHTAGLASVEACESNLDLAKESNVDLAKNMATFLSKKNGNCAIFEAGSILHKAMVEKGSRVALQILSRQIHLLGRPKYKTQKYKGIKGLDGEM